VRALRLVGATLAALAVGVPASSAATTEVTMPGTVFTPGTVRVLVGDSVTWMNHDTRPHTATAEDSSFDTGSISPHGEATASFPVAGTVSYYCRIHSFMRGSVEVVALLLSGPATPPAKGAAATLTGRAGAGISSVTLERAAGAGWTPVATTTPAAGGGFAFAVRVTGPATFRVSAGTATSTSVTLRPIDLRVGLTTKRRGSTYTLRAGVAPRGRAGVVLFQRYVPELFRWRTIARRHVDRTGHARLVLRAVHRTRIRAVVRTGGTEIASPAVRIGRRPPFG
jgi:plastocyanin